MIRHGRRPATLLGLLAVLSLLPAAALAQTAECTALRAQLDAAGPGGDPGRYDIALRQQREEIERTRAYADQTGCGDGFFDDPDSPQCRALARRIGALQGALQRLQDQAARRDPEADDRRRALQEGYDARCSAAGGEADTSPSTMPVDPDAPAAAAPGASARTAVVLCVRHCDGAYYPLAVDVRPDKLGDMSRICQAQCPSAESSAYAGHDAEDPSEALSSDGSAYSALPAAFLFRKGSTPQCACRAPHQSWADALAGAEAMLEPHKGDVTVTPAIAAAMVRPVPMPAISPSTRPAPASRKAPKKAPQAVPPLVIPPPDPAQPPDAARDLTRDFRRSAPTL